MPLKVVSESIQGPLSGQKLEDLGFPIGVENGNQHATAEAVYTQDCISCWLTFELGAAESRLVVELRPPRRPSVNVILEQALFLNQEQDSAAVGCSSNNLSRVFVP